MATLSVVAEQVGQVEGLKDRFGLVILNSAGSQILLERQADTWILPEISIPRFTRPAEQITLLLRKQWGLRAVLLFSAVIDSGEEKQYCSVIEACGDREHAPVGLKWCPVGDLSHNLSDRSTVDLVQACIGKACQSWFGVNPAPFSRLGWIHRLQQWVRATVLPLGIELTDFQQLNGSETFSLARIETTKKPLWFKAVGEPNLREFPITLKLFSLFPDYVPKILASDPLLNGWLMESGGQITLGETDNLHTWVGAVRRLAQLQIASIGHSAELLKAGCRDLRIETLKSLLSPFFEVIGNLMDQQTKTTPAPLDRSDLIALARTVEDALYLVSKDPIADALGHTDFNPGNVLVDGERCVITDWAEAHVGHPFLTFEYLRAHLNRSFPSLVEHLNCLEEVYCQPWQEIATAANIARALQLSPLIAIYAYASSGPSWRDPERVAMPRVPAYLRSLARRMKKEADVLRQGGICA